MNDQATEPLSSNMFVILFSVDVKLTPRLYAIAERCIYSVYSVSRSACRLPSFRGPSHVHLCMTNFIRREVVPTRRWGEVIATE